jgi:hypothetical protein
MKDNKESCIVSKLWRCVAMCTDLVQWVQIWFDEYKFGAEGMNLVFVGKNLVLQKCKFGADVQRFGSMGMNLVQCGQIWFLWVKIWL